MWTTHPLRNPDIGSFIAEKDKTALLFAWATYRNVTVMKTPQQLSQETIEEFRVIYREEFGRTLSDDEVQEMALRLLRFFGVLLEPPVRQDFNRDGTV